MKTTMTRERASLALFLIFLTTATVFYLGGISSVPFHPDESTYIFTSKDAETYLRNPIHLAYQHENSADPRQRYRLLDAPLARTLIGIGRLTMGTPDLPADWNWSLSWEDNKASGALPPEWTLRTARFSVAWLYPFSLLFLFLAARRAGGDFTAWTAAILLATNTLVLLHTRRAMAESGLLFSVAVTMWSLTQAERHPWLTALPAAIAFSAKQTLAALSPVALLAVLWQPGKSRKHIVRSAALFAGLFFAVFTLLHPFLWNEPLSAVQAAVQLRQDLMKAQTSDMPDQALSTPGERLVAMIAHLYLTPPAFAEAANYQAETAGAEQAYLSNTIHSVFRSLAGGAILFFLSLFGFVTAGLQALRMETAAKRRLILLLSATAAQTTALFILIPLAWQRYYVPLVPFACLWAAFGTNQIRLAMLGTLKHQMPQIER